MRVIWWEFSKKKVSEYYKILIFFIKHQNSFFHLTKKAKNINNGQWPLFQVLIYIVLICIYKKRREKNAFYIVIILSFCWFILEYLISIKKRFMVPFYGWSSTASRLEPLWGGSLLFTTKFPEIPGTHFIDLGRMNGWVGLGTTQWFWTREPWIGNPVP